MNMGLEAWQQAPDTCEGSFNPYELVAVVWGWEVVG